MSVKVKLPDGTIDVPEAWMDCPEGTEGHFFLHKALPKFDLETARTLRGVKWVCDRDQDGNKLVWGARTFYAMGGSHKEFDPDWVISSMHLRASMVGV